MPTPMCRADGEAAKPSCMLTMQRFSCSRGAAYVRTPDAECCIFACFQPDFFRVLGDECGSVLLWVQFFRPQQGTYARTVCCRSLNIEAFERGEVRRHSKLFRSFHAGGCWEAPRPDLANINICEHASIPTGDWSTDHKHCHWQCYARVRHWAGLAAVAWLFIRQSGCVMSVSTFWTHCRPLPLQYHMRAHRTLTRARDKEHYLLLTELIYCWHIGKAIHSYRYSDIQVLLECRIEDLKISYASAESVSF
ncbi:hypothetical protein FA95DRAFT_887862 [Auriscalpium vulgare]|uniref:Uncharacterized protein n=1 Tax=Auriscalpium vulgare TaxID=40419 RepID=A0ACB8R9R1_9AGAM|nr:hypothetical protein FA95DRAFT_887862 [Auriscalpium vulgare]